MDTEAEVDTAAGRLTKETEMDTGTETMDKG